MANFSYEDYEKRTSSKEGTDFKVGFFNLKDDGDFAIVRFNYATLQEFNIVTVHNIKTTNKDGKETYKRISCLRGPNDPISKCPLCAAENKLSLKFYVNLIEYVTDESGHIVPKAKVWERPASFSSDLKVHMEEYGDLRNQLFKVKRVGVRGNMKTEYKLIPVSSEVYKPEIYVKDFSDFDGFKASGSSYLVKTADEMRAFLSTGDFPKVDKSATATTTATAVNTTAATTVAAVEATHTTGVTGPAQPAAAVVTEEAKPAANPADGRPQRFTF